MNLSWMNAAACVGADPALFDQEAEFRDSLRAQLICHSCPVRAECREYGRKIHAGGVWGGVSHKGGPRAEQDRHRIVVRRKAAG